MPFIPVPNVAELAFNYLMAGQQTANVFHYQMPGVAADDDLVELGQAAITYWTNSMRGNYPSTVTLQSIRVTDLTLVNSPSVVVSTTLPLAGVRAGNQLPNSCALVITKRSQFRGRSFRGRIYHGPLNEGDVTDNTVAAATVTGLVTSYSGLMTLTTTLGVWEMVIVSRYTNKNARSSGIFTPVLTMTSDGVVDSQRRRLPGRGR